MGGVVGKLLKSLSCRSACTLGDTKVAELGYQPRGGFYFDDYDLKVKDLVRISKTLEKRRKSTTTPPGSPALRSVHTITEL